MKRKRTFEDWLKTRPPEVRLVAHELQLAPMSKVGDYWLLGFGEYTGGGVGLIVTPVKPGGGKQASAAAYAARLQICPACTQAKRWECAHASAALKAL